VSDLRKAAKDLLHEYDSGIFDDDHDLIHAVNALRAALAAPRPEPVAWMESPHGVIRANPDYRSNFPSQLLHWQIPLYTAPPAPQPEPVAVSARHRFRHPRNGPDWGKWYECSVRNRPAWEIDSQGYEVEYRPLYAAPPAAAPERGC
jgi:hypothetical protein